MKPIALSSAALEYAQPANASTRPVRAAAAGARAATFLLLGFLALFASSGAFAQVDVTASAGTPAASYTTLKGAFDAINAGTHQGVIGIGISGNTTETAPAVLNASGAGAAVYTTIGIQPTGGAARSISGAIAAGSPLIDYNGADNVTIDGLNTGGNSLTIANTTASTMTGTATFRYIGGATNNVVTNANIQGSSSSSVATNGGTFFFSTDAVTANGNDNNTISNNNIGPAGANLPSKAILCNGSTTTAAIGNSGNIVNNNNIFDFFAATVTSAGVGTNAGCNTWTITNNRFFQTATRTWTTGALHTPILLSNTTSPSGAQGFIVTGNIIGFASNTQTGTYTMTGSTGKFVGIQFNGITGGTVSNINSNTVAAVSVTGVTSNGTGTASPFTPIIIVNGVANTNNNIIGSQSATGSLVFSTTTATTSDIHGIFNFSFDDWTANGNTIGGLSVTNLGAASIVVNLMKANTSTAKVFNGATNSVGGTVANSIQLTSTGAASQVMGMVTLNAIATWNQNTVRNLTNNNGAGTTTAASLIGMLLGSATPIQNVTQNSIFNLANTNTTVATVVTGIQFTGGTGNLVARNLIHSLTTASNSATAEVNGIRVAGGTTTYRNNMIAVGAGITNAIGTGVTNGISGINEPAAGTDNFFHNSVYIGGAPTAGVGSSFAFNSTQVTVVRNYRGNIFFNARSNAGATGKNYAIRVGGTAPNPAGLTSNNNLLFTNGTGAVFGFFNALDVPDLPTWRTVTGQDFGSFALDPVYNAPAAATPDLHIHPTNPTPAEGNGVDVGVIDDFDGQTRASFTPVDIGADAGNFNGVDLLAPQIAYTPLGSTSLTTNRTLAPVTITDVTGVAIGPVAPRIYFRKNANPYFSQACTLTTGTVNNGTWDCIINNALMGGVALADVINYFVVAQDTVGNLGSNPPGAGGADVNSATPPPAPNAYTIVPAVSGPINVGATEAFTSLTNPGGLFQALNGSAFTGNVTVNVTSDLLAETGTHPLNRFSEDGVGGYTLVLRPSGAARAITGTATTALIRMNGASRVTIDGSIDSLGTDRSLTITNTSVTTPSVVLFGSTGTTPVTNDTLKNCIIVNGVNTSSAIVISDAGVVGNAGFFSTIVIQNNDIRRAFIGVFATGGTIPQNGSNLTYTQNTLNNTAANSIRLVGLYMQGVNGATVSQNTIGNFDAVNDESDTGIWLATGTINAVVSANTVSTIGYTGTNVFNPIGINITSNVAGTNNVVTGNTVSNIVGNGSNSGSVTPVRGIAISFATSDMIVEKNKVQGINNTSTGTWGVHGIDLNAGNNITVRNNFISDVNQNMSGGAAFNPTFAIIGLRVNAGTGHRIYNNSINLFGPMAGTATTSLLTAAFALVNTSSTGCDVRDNIFANNITGGTTSIAHVSAFLPAGGTAAMNLTWNNNAYFFGTDVARQGVGQAGTVAGVNFFTTLAAQAAYTSTLSGAGTNDNASQASNGATPFVSTTDLHLVPASPLNSAGVPLAGVTVDIDDEPRSATTPSIGADEQVADLSITKTDGTATATPGGSTTYTITASNAGPAATTGTVADTFPGTLTCNWTCVGAGGGTCTAGPVAGNINDPVTLPAGGSVTYTATCNISAAATGSLVNTATVTGVAGDPNALNNTATDTDTLVASANLGITKTDGVASVTAGGSTIYTIVASNAGPSNTTATVADTFPASLTCSWTCVGAGGGTCSAGPTAGNINDAVTLPSGGSVTYTATCNVSAAATGSIINTATVTGAATDPVPGNNTATDTDTVAFSANLGITKTDGVASVTAGGSTTYTITASNAGPSNTTGTVADTFPGTLTCNWTCVGAGGGTCTAGPVAGNINNAVTLPAGGSVTYTATCNVSAAATGSIINTATVTGAATDPVPGNNTATDTDTVTQSANLGITKTDGVISVAAGGSTTYTIVASNAGPSNTTGTVADTFPATLTCTWTCVGAGGGTCTAGPVAGNINNAVTLPAGGSVTYTASCNVSPSATGSIINTATVTGAATDPVPGNNSATDTDSVTATSDIAISKTVNNATPTLGNNVIFTITATNNGPANATGVAVEDLLPPGLAYVSDVPSQGSYNNTTGLWTVGNLANGASATLALTATVNRTQALVNQASVAGHTEQDLRGANNTATSRLNGAALADIQVSESVDDETPAISQDVFFLVTARNAGPSAATLVSLTDNLPAGLTYVSHVPSQGTYTPGTGVWDVGSLGSGISATLTVRMTNTVATPVTRTVTKTGATQEDLITGNDAASVTLNPTVTQVDLALSKIASQEPVAAGVSFGYFIVVTNNGPGDATNVTVTDNLPAGLTLVTATASQGSCSGDPNITCNLGNLTAGGSAVVNLVVTKTVGGPVTNTATVAATEADPNSANNTNGDSTTPVELITFEVE